MQQAAIGNCPVPDAAVADPYEPAAPWAGLVGPMGEASSSRQRGGASPWRPVGPIRPAPLRRGCVQLGELVLGNAQARSRDVLAQMRHR
jgi:hypothetical protein